MNKPNEQMQSQGAEMLSIPEEGAENVAVKVYLNTEQEQQEPWGEEMKEKSLIGLSCPESFLHVCSRSRKDTQWKEF